MSVPRAQPNPRDEIINFLPEMRAFAISLTRDASSADDLVQDAIVKAWKSFHQFQSDTNLRAWRFTIVRNTFYSDLRRKRREVEHAEQGPTEDATDDRGADPIIAVMDFEKLFPHCRMNSAKHWFWLAHPACPTKRRQKPATLPSARSKAASIVAANVWPNCWGMILTTVPAQPTGDRINTRLWLHNLIC
jgi:RNA polymerase sigma factor (sigma-70 family)